MEYAKSLLYIMGERRCIEVHYINAATPILYRSAYPNSVILYISLDYWTDIFLVFTHSEVGL